MYDVAGRHTSSPLQSVKRCPWNGEFFWRHFWAKFIRLRPGIWVRAVHSDTRNEGPAGQRTNCW